MTTTRLTRELATRRLNLALPEESLALAQSDWCRIAHRWQADRSRKRLLSQATNLDSRRGEERLARRAEPSIHSRSTRPQRRSASTVKRQQFVAVATYSDGTNARCDGVGSFSIEQRRRCRDRRRRAPHFGPGRAKLSSWPVSTLTPSAARSCSCRPDEPFEPRDETPANYIDELVNQKLRMLRIHPSPLCTDEEFLRRVTLDIAGRLPTREERDTFLGNESPTQRSEKIDALLAGPEFAQLWAQKWAELLLVRTEPNRVEYKPMYLYWQWLTEQIAEGKPLDEMVRHLLSASGSTFDTPTTNFYQIEPNTNKVAENVAQSFLGIRIQCAQCHNHPFDRWTMNDYYSFAAFFSQIGRKKSEDYREWMVYNRRSGEMRHPMGGRVMKPKVLGGEQPEMNGRDRRAVLADWIVSPDNPYFAVSVANRVWAHFFGSGIVEPVDDIRVSNPPSNPALFDKLGQQLIDDQYNVRRLVQDICNSKNLPALL